MRERIFQGALFAAILLALLAPTARTSADAGVPTGVAANAPAVAGQFVVRFAPQSQRAGRRDLLDRVGAQTVGEITQLDASVIRLPTAKAATALATLASSAAVRSVEPDFLAVGAMTPNDPSYTAQYAPQKIKADQAWAITTGSASVLVAVVDSGADFAHPDLQGKLIAGWDFVNNDATPADDHGHGTHVAGIIGAATNNGQGVAGIGYETRVLVVKVLDQANSGAYSTIAQGIIYAADQGARIINLSLGGTVASSLLEDAVTYAASRGALVVAAAGNGGSSAPYYPAAYATVLAVSATDANDNRYSPSNYADYVAVAAPGASIYSTSWESGTSGYRYRSGTSQAAAHVSAVAALLLAQDGTRTSAQLRNLIESGADDLGAAGKDPYFGYGRLNAYRAVTAGGGSPPPTPTATPTPTPQPATIHVGDLDGSPSVLNSKWWRATVTITVHTSMESAVANATVTIGWGGGASGTDSCVTDGAGRCTLTSASISTKKTSATLTVQGVSHASHGYSAAANHDPDADSNGTTITVHRP